MPFKLTPVAVLAMYYPYGVTVQHLNYGTPSPSDPRGKLVGLASFPNGHGGKVTLEKPSAAVERAASRNPGAEHFLTPYPGDCKPVLKPFAALCEPLPDGTVPALEAAKSVIGDGDGDTDGYSPDWATADASIRGTAPFREVHIHWAYRAANGDGLALEDDLNGCLTINEDWSAYEMTEEGKQPVGPALYDYLRSLHFAVGLEADQYVIGKEVGNG